MRIAVISDMHSNIDALRAAYEDIGNRGVDRIISTGDLVGYLPFPNEVVDFMKEQGIESIQGNHDLKIAEAASVDEKDVEGLDEADLQARASSIYTNMTISDENREYLKKLEKDKRFKAGNLSILFTHGSPRRIDEYLYDDEKLMEEIYDLFDEDIIVTGHTHKPYYRKMKDKHFINAGSVGKSKHGKANGTYIIIDILDDQVKVEIIEFDYDMSEVINEIKKSKYMSNGLVDMLLEGK